ncbi:MAG: serine/threonine-protein kinase [Anaerolineales bacterium]
MPFNPGENIGPYRIIEQLGQGGMATVYKAYHAALDRYVAIKVLHPAFNEDNTFEMRFQREARVVAKLEHSNIVPVYDYAEHEKRPYLVMKFIEGDTLKAYMGKGPLTADDIRKIVDAVGSALAYAHKQGILHRDIKPSNVLVATDGQMYLADFGLARIAQSGESTLSSDMIMGTPQYISPEQAMGKKDLDAGTDIYSFGVMLYEMVVGQVPFSADTPFSIIHDHIYSPLPLPHTVNPTVPEPVERVLLKALAKDRLDRYDDVMEMVEAFKDAWEEAGVPMQGTMVRLRKERTGSQSKSTQAAPAQTVAAGPTKMLVSSEPTKMAAKAEVAVPPAPDVKKKRSPLIWIGAGLALVLCLSFLVVARNNRLFARLIGAANPPKATETVVVEVSPTIESTLAASEPTLTPAPSEPELPATVLEARQKANDNPNDPNLQLDLAIAYMHANKPALVYETLAKTIQVAGPDNEAFYRAAGDKLVSQEQAFLPAAAMYFQAVKTYGLNGSVPEDLENAFHEAYYKAADRPETANMLPFDKVGQVDQPIALIAQSRNAFYSGHLDDAHTFLNQVKSLKPNMYEAFLLEAEYYAAEGEPAKAGLITRSLTSDLSVPQWIRIYAEDIQKKLPK